MKIASFISLFFLCFLFSNDFCNTSDLNSEDIKINSSRAYYNIGDVISDEDQQHEYSVCYSDGNYETGSTFRLADYTNEIILISMNATW